MDSENIFDETIVNVKETSLVLKDKTALIDPKIPITELLGHLNQKQSIYLTFIVCGIEPLEAIKLARISNETVTEWSLNDAKYNKVSNFILDSRERFAGEIIDNYKQKLAIMTLKLLDKFIGRCLSEGVTSSDDEKYAMQAANLVGKMYPDSGSLPQVKGQFEEWIHRKRV